MKKISLSASVLILSSFVAVNQISAQSSDERKTAERKPTVKVESNKPIESNAATPSVVKSLNTLGGDVTLQAGANITVTPNGNGLIVAAPNALTSVLTDASLTGNGTISNPLRVVAAATESATPFSESVAFTIPANISADGAELLTVPAGKRLVIEYASGRCNVPPGQFIFQFEMSIYSPTLPKRSAQIIVPTIVGSDSTLGNIYAASSPVKFYVDAGYTVQVLAWRGSVASGTVSCGFNYSGSLVNQP